ncbi:hypothetical protein AB434_3024 [Heyndrickxia coagulans]|uniref:Uncharacterized protein n=1 Tax=Heyndrickxia coagulans TaxID=1398 RepID=A0AAN0WCI0_HEYCO|nr:hypothetical protein SB48_HM08orf03589 [Heyndrickxia coagulans]AKN55429.1 hypothetical protein AB434_3024 [Heyndrickxia coagulans]KYC63470.1 hypothetical protein B4100_3512 [Heyndrickxia coagulans]
MIPPHIRMNTVYSKEIQAASYGIALIYLPIFAQVGLFPGQKVSPGLAT